MNVALSKPMSLDEFLAWEDCQELRYEFDGFEPQAMAGGTAAHFAIQRNILFSLTARLRGQPCQPHGSELKILVAGRIRYPEAFVACTPITPTSQNRGRPGCRVQSFQRRLGQRRPGHQNVEYRATLSIQRYVVLQQTHAGATVFTRRGEDWLTELVSGPEAILRMPEIGIELPLSELYIDVGLGTEEAESGTNLDCQLTP